MPNPVPVVAALAALAFATAPVSIAPAWAASQTFQTELDPAPFDATNKDYVVGSGSVTASLDGKTLTISGSFSGLSSPASGAELRMGLAMGVLGDSIGPLAATHAASGTLSGKIALTPKQLAALHARSLYIRIDSEKAPDGSLQGWLDAAGE